MPTHCFRIDVLFSKIHFNDIFIVLFILNVYNVTVCNGFASDFQALYCFQLHFRTLIPNDVTDIGL